MWQTWDSHPYNKWDGINGSGSATSADKQVRILSVKIASSSTATVCKASSVMKDLSINLRYKIHISIMHGSVTHLAKYGTAQRQLDTVYVKSFEVEKFRRFCRWLLIYETFPPKLFMYKMSFVVKGFTTKLFL